MLKDGSDLEGSNVHAYIALSWPIHTKEIATKDIQEAVDNAGMSGTCKNILTRQKTKWDDHSALTPLLI